MIKFFLPFFLSFLIVVLPNEAKAVPDSFSGLVEKLLPTVVNISTSQTVEAGETFPGLPQELFPPGHPFEKFNEFFDQFNAGKDGNGEIRKEKLTSLGSGFIISADGIVVTNYHVIANAEEITVTLQDESQYKAELVGRDPKTDLAVLRMEVDDNSRKDLPFAKFGDSDAAKVGDWVIAIGNPFNLGGTVTAGIISARARDINAGPFDNFIQTDAAINKGNSGGPMFNMQGEVVGVNSAIFSPSGGNVGIGFAIPASMAEPIINQLKQGKEIKRGWLGVKIQTVTKEIAESLDLEKDKGALVVDVVKGSPAEDAGFEKGDIILTFDGKEIATMRKLPRIVAETEVGKKVNVEFLRKGKKKELKVKLGLLEEDEDNIPVSVSSKDSDKKESSAEEFLGMKLLELDDELRTRYKFEKGVEGVIVVMVQSGSEADARRIRPGDLISEANQEKIKDVDDLKKAIKDARNSGRKSVLLYISRKGDSLFIALPLKQD